MLNHIWQRLQPQVCLGMTLQAWHTCVWEVSPILRCTSSQALSGWMGSVAAQLFSGLSRDVRSGSSLGSGWATQGHSCAVLAMFLGLLCCWKVNLHPSLEVLSALEQVVINDLFVLCSVHLSLDPDRLPVDASKKHPYSMILSPPCSQ